jgi:hypothetical protein
VILIKARETGARSRRDKDMLDDKAIKQIIRVFRMGEFSISPRKRAKLPVFRAFHREIWKNVLFPHIKL